MEEVKQASAEEALPTERESGTDPTLPAESESVAPAAETPALWQERLAAERRGLEAEQRRTRDERGRLRVDEQLREIGALDGDIRSLDDLMDMDDYGEVYERVKKGLSLTEAFKLTRWEALMEKAAARGAQQARLAAVSKGHLTSLAAGAGSQGLEGVPADVAAQFRLAKPGITEGEIRRKYRKYQNYKRQ